MPFDLYCPECQTRLRLDEQPDDDDVIECPKCASTFTPDESEPPKKPKRSSRKPAARSNKKKPSASGSGKEKANAPKVRTGINPFLLLGIVVGALAAYIAAASATITALSKAGRVTDMMAYVPKDATVVRGANLKILSRYPGYKSEYDRYATAPVAAGLTALQTASELEDKDAFIDYVLTGTTKDGTIHAIRCRDDIDAELLGQKLNGVSVNADGIPCFRLPATAAGILAGAVMYIPTKRHVVVVRGGAGLLRSSLGSYKDESTSFLADLTDAGAMAMSGHTWVILLGQAQIAANYATPLAEDKQLKNQYVKEAAKAKELGAWNSFGGRVRFGAALACSSSDAASSVARSLRESEFGKGDDAEFTREFKNAFPGSWNKEFRAFLSDISFGSSGDAVYYKTSAGGETGIKLLTIVDITVVGSAPR
ncbi:MAG: hypothetical protein LC104_05520 [Bacteroidales bacterium]|nr:hypothetical protein [Bacteroidales bacterium]